MDYEKVKADYEKALEWLSETYVMALNIIHYMHDKYAYESVRWLCTTRNATVPSVAGVSGLSIAGGSCPCKYAKVYPNLNKDARPLGP